MKLLIADDHALFRDGLKKIIFEKIPDVEIGEASSYGELIEKLNKFDWDIIILDLNMPGRSGFEALIELKTKKPDAKILVLSMYPESQFATRSIKAGAKGYLTKGASVEELIEAINSILTGDVYFTKEVAKVIAEDLRTNIDSKINSLSDREFQIFMLLAEGNSVSSIAKKLSLSIKTISTFKKRILDKLGLESSVDLVKFAIENKLITISSKNDKS